MAKYNLKYTGSEMDTLLDNANSLSGIIVMWSGAIENIPMGWTLCDGTNGTPDLRNRFIVGAGSTYNVDEIGGSATVALTTAQMPSHNHTVTGGSHTHKVYYDSDMNSKGDNNGHGTLTAKYDTGLGSISGQEYYNHYVNTDTGVTDPGTHSHTVGSSGSGSAHENRPPYYALAYIMKI